MYVGVTIFLLCREMRHRRLFVAPYGRDVVMAVGWYSIGCSYSIGLETLTRIVCYVRRFQIWSVYVCVAMKLDADYLKPLKVV